MTECSVCRTSALATGKSKVTLLRRLPGHGASLGDFLSTFFGIKVETSSSCALCNDCRKKVLKVNRCREAVQQAERELQSTLNNSSSLAQLRRKRSLSPTTAGPSHITPAKKPCRPTNTPLQPGVQLAAASPAISPISASRDVKKRLPFSPRRRPKRELDRFVSPSHWSNRLHLFPNIVEHFLSTIASETKSMKKCVAHELDINYGEGKLQTLDLYLPQHQTEDSPVLLSIHGGYWQASSKDDYGLFAWHPAKQGAVVAVVNYTIAPMGTLPQMINDVEQAVLYMAKKFPKARGFYIIGHSAGGQLGAMMLSVDWSEKYGLPKDFIKGACLVSGVFDVRPLVGSYVNEPLHMTDEQAYQVSPIIPTNLSEAIRLCPRCKIINVCGEHDPPIFHRMMREYTNELSKGGVDATCEVIPGLDHFELIERLSEAEYSLTQTVLGMMSLPPPKKKTEKEII